MQVKVTVEDVNDSFPTFLDEIDETLLISENAVYGTYVASIQATDYDQGDNGAVTYSLRDEPSKSYEL